MSTPRVSATDALQRLREGNTRFAEDNRSVESIPDRNRLYEHLGGQAPFAVVLGCSDSRVPVEIIFDVGLGNLFVVRVAGNIVAPSLVGSIEFAAEKFGTRLVVVLGHTRCGAIEATLGSLQQDGADTTGFVNDIVDSIRPSVEPLIAADTQQDSDALLDKAVRANVRASAEFLRHGSETLGKLIRDDGLMIVGAEYSLETGVVEFFDGLPKSG